MSSYVSDSLFTPSFFGRAGTLRPRQSVIPSETIRTKRCSASGAAVAQDHSATHELHMGGGSSPTALDTISIDYQVSAYNRCSLRLGNSLAASSQKAVPTR